MPINRSFSGRNRDVHNHGGRLPPGQSLTEGFPVLTAGPTPTTTAHFPSATETAESTDRDAQYREVGGR